MSTSARVLLAVMTGVFTAVGVLGAVFVGVKLNDMIGPSSESGPTRPIAAIGPDSTSSGGPVETKEDPPPSPPDSPEPPSEKPPPAEPSPEEQPPQKPTAEDSPADESSDEELPDNSPAEPEDSSSEAKLDEPEGPPPPQGESDDPEASPKGEPPEPEEDRDPFEDILARERFLVLPPRKTPDTEIAKVFVSSATACNLALLGGEVVLGKGREVVIQPGDTDDGTRVWAVGAEVTGSLGKKNLSIGTFRLKDRSLTFQWQTGSSLPAWGERLRYCLLRVTIEGESELCFLSKPKEVESIKLDFKDSELRLNLPLSESTIPDKQYLRVEVSAEDYPEYEREPDRAWEPEETGMIRITDPDGLDDVFLFDLETEFVLEKRCMLTCKAVVHSKVPQRDGSIKEITKDLSLRWPELEKRKHKREKAKLRRAQEKTARELMAAKKVLDETDRVSVRDTATLLEVQRQRFLARQMVANCERAEDLNEELEAFLEEYGEWLACLETALEEIIAGGRLHFTVFVEVEGGRVVLLRTRSDDSSEDHDGDASPASGRDSDG